MCSTQTPHYQRTRTQAPTLPITTATCCQRCTANSSVTLATLLLLVMMALSLRGASAAPKPQSCINCDTNESSKKQQIASKLNYEEFHVEHEVTRKDAISALKALNESFYLGISPTRTCKSVNCNEQVMRYCKGPQFINDHCWCELSHNNEGLPFVPHTCYVGEKIYNASVGSCFFFEELKDCCCAASLAKQWRYLSSSSSLYERSHLLTVSLVLLLSIAFRGNYLLEYRILSH